MCSARRSAVTGPAKAWFRTRAKRSCSGMRSSCQLLSCQRSENQTAGQRSATAEHFICLVSRFAQHRRYGQEQARKQSIEALAGNSKYSKGNKGQQKVAQDEAVHDAAAGGGGSRSNGEIRQSGDDFFEPVKIEIGNRAAESEAEGDAPSEK